MFYDEELIPMKKTKNTGEHISIIITKEIMLIKTHFGTGLYNQREIDEIASSKD